MYKSYDLQMLCIPYLFLYISFRPYSTEVPVVSITQPTLTGQQVKVDYALAVEFVTTANWSFVCEIRLYRSGSLINSRIFNRSDQQAGNQRYPISSTYVDTAPSNNPTTVYQVRVVVTTAVNITSATTGLYNNINSITFTP